MAQLNDLIVTGSSRFLNKIQGTAASADMLTTSAGGAGTPVYFSDGKPVACTLSSISVGSAGNAASVNGTAFGSAATCAKGDFLASGAAAASANKTTGTLTLQVKGTTKATFNGNTTTFNVTTSDLGIGTAGLKASGDFLSSTTKYAGSTVTGGMASVAHSTEKSLTLQLNGGTSTAWNGSAAVTFNVTPSGIGALSSTGTAVDSDKLGGQSSTYYAPASSIPSVPVTSVIGDGTWTSATTSGGVVTVSHVGGSGSTGDAGPTAATVNLAWNTVSKVSVPYFTYDETGHVSGSSAVSMGIKLPANPNTNTVSTLRGDYTYLKTGADVGVKRNSLIAKDSEGYYQSFTSGSSTASSKAINRTTYFDISKIFYYGGTANVAINTNMSTATLYYAVASIDLRYSLNIATTTLTAREPVYLIFDKTASTVGTDGTRCYKLAGTSTNDWFTQTLPTSADGNIYVEIGKGVRDYRSDLTIYQTYYEYTDRLHSYDSISALEDKVIAYFGYNPLVPEYTCSISYQTLIDDGYSWIRDGKLEAVLRLGNNESQVCKSIKYDDTEDFDFVDFYFTDKILHYTSSGISAIDIPPIPEILEITITDDNGTLSCDKTFTDIKTWVDQDGHYVDDIQARLSVVSTDIIEYEAKNVRYHYDSTITNMGHIYLYFDCGLVEVSESQGETDVVQYINVANGLQFAHTEGVRTTASGYASHAEGLQTTASGVFSHVEGGNVVASGDYSHAEGQQTSASGEYAHAEGYITKSTSTASHAEGRNTVASGDYSHAEGKDSAATTSYAHAEGGTTKASGEASHAEGGSTTASGKWSHAEGCGTIASSTAAHAEGYHTTAEGDYSHAEGYLTFASTTRAHAEGSSSSATGDAAHAEGGQVIASGNYSHAEGYRTTASMGYAHAEGSYTIASGYSSHAGGLYTIANLSRQTAIGQYNATVANTYFIIGNGTGTAARSNAMYVTTAGNINCVSVTQTSDRRLKDNISNISTTDIAIYDKLQPKSFTLKSDDIKSKHYGFIAQDVLQSFEELGLPSSYVGIVHQDQNEQGYYNINYTELIALLVEKQKIMQQEIDELKAAVAALKQHQS